MTSAGILFHRRLTEETISTSMTLKRKIESDTAIQGMIIDKRSGKPARDLWRDIKISIEKSAVCIFDLTAFRPNVVLELGYALATKTEDQVFITFRKRKSKGKLPEWLLTDIGHLQRHDYKNIADLEKFIRDQLNLIPFQNNWKSFAEDCNTTNASDKYRDFGLKVLQNIRENGSRSQDQIQSLVAGSACRLSKMIELMRKNKLIARGRGPNGRYAISELE